MRLQERNNDYQHKIENQKKQIEFERKLRLHKNLADNQNVLQHKREEHKRNKEYQLKMENMRLQLQQKNYQRNYF